MNLDLVERIIQEVSRDYHVNGSLSPYVLQRMVDLHLAAGVRRSAETGCGLTTLVLSNISEAHTAFADGSGDSLQKTRTHPYLREHTVRFVVGPSQTTLPRHDFGESLDFVLLDGPHAYPFPDLEYYYFYPHVRLGGILMVDDVHIPTIGALYMFLREDEMWEHLGDVETTAFFRRTHAPTHNPVGDDWHLQRFNRRYFPYPTALAPVFGEGWRAKEFGEAGTQRTVPSLAAKPVAREIAAILDQQAVERERFRANELARQLQAERRAYEVNSLALNRKLVALQAALRRLQREKAAAEAEAAALKDLFDQQGQ